MNTSQIQALDRLLVEKAASTGFEIDGVPDALRNSEFVDREVRPPERCPVVDRCREPCRCSVGEDRIEVECDDGHTAELPVESNTFYSILFERVVRSIADIAGLEVESFDDDSLPRYVSASTSEGFNLYLIVSPSDNRAAINEICVETLSEESPAFLVAPESEISDLLEIKALFSSGNLIYTATVPMLSEEDEIRSSLTAIDEVQSLENRVLDGLEDEHEVVYRINSNPRYILTELNHMRLLRLAGELPQSSGTRLEKVAESAFSHLFVSNPGSGGEDDRGSNLPDSLFLISEKSLPRMYDSVLGIVDAKSGKNASFGSEPVDGKHDEYLKRARRQSIGADLQAHIFVVLGFDGQKELDFFDEMNEEYQEGEFMLVFTAEALSLIMSAYLSHTLSNELKLVRGSFRTVIYPFFNPEKFREADLGGITREVGWNQEEYNNEYMQRENLLIVTPEVVKQRIIDCCESPGNAEQLLNSYFQPLPTA